MDSIDRFIPILLCIAVAVLQLRLSCSLQIVASLLGAWQLAGTPFLT